MNKSETGRTSERDLVLPPDDVRVLEVELGVEVSRGQLDSGVLGDMPHL